MTSEPPHRALLGSVAASLDDVVARVALDVREPEDRVRPAVALIVDALREADELTEARRAALAEHGARAAREEVPLPALLDRYLSSGWVLLEAAAERAMRGPGDEAASPDAVARLGAVLLKAGDVAAAALSEGYGRVERERAAQTAAAKAELLDAFLSLAPADAAGAALLARRARNAGLDPSLPRTLFAIGPVGPPPENPGHLDDALQALARQIGTPPRAAGAAGSPEPQVALRSGLLIVLATRDSRPGRRVEAAIRRSASGTPWLAIHADVPAGLSGVAAAYVSAADALVAARAAGISGGVLSAEDLLLERSLLAAGPLTVEAVGHELGPVVAARGGAVLLETLRAYLEHGQNLRATARALEVAPRTVSYRLARAEKLLGRPLEGGAWLRVAAALFAERLVNT